MGRAVAALQNINLIWTSLVMSNLYFEQGFCFSYTVKEKNIIALLKINVTNQLYLAPWGEKVLPVDTRELGNVFGVPFNSSQVDSR